MAVIFLLSMETFTRQKKHVVGSSCLKYNNALLDCYLVFQNVSWQTIKTFSLLCLGILDLSLHLRGMVYRSVVKPQMNFAVQASAQPLYYRGTTQHILKITDSFLSVKS